jgi:hypothetical protein
MVDRVERPAVGLRQHRVQVAGPERESSARCRQRPRRVSWLTPCSLLSRVSRAAIWALLAECSPRSASRLVWPEGGVNRRRHSNREPPVDKVLWFVPGSC